MASNGERAASLRRLRWRMRGAWLWPTFVGVTIAEGFLLDELPFYGDGPGGVVPGILVAGFFNLAAVALVAPLVARRIRRWHADLPRAVAFDYAGSVLVWLVAAALLTGGLLHRPAAQERRRQEAHLYVAIERYVRAQAPDHAAYLGGADWLRLAEDLYRACVPGPDPRRALCLFLETDQEPPGVRRDTDRTPNAGY